MYKIKLLIWFVSLVLLTSCQNNLSIEKSISVGYFSGEENAVLFKNKLQSKLSGTFNNFNSSNNYDLVKGSITLTESGLGITSEKTVSSKKITVNAVINVESNNNNCSKISKNYSNSIITRISSSSANNSNLASIENSKDILFDNIISNIIDDIILDYYGYKCV